MSANSLETSTIDRFPHIGQRQGPPSDVRDETFIGYLSDPSDMDIGQPDDRSPP
ncbi:hypothetical protein [Neorhodopirellula lusitana]|uniref:hypothetical protein n=1 Tax=Neorhodopirellula lusitana TaxID=445327 RepID=UPI0024B83B6E|nr:hypothetical protein [Neorhodopirellula lusitana]